MSRVRLRILLNIPRVNVHLRSADAELPASWHRVACVHGQVHHDLFDHAGVGVDRRQVLGEIKFQNDVLAQRAFQHGRDLADDFVQIQRALLHDLAAAEGQ